MSERNPEAQFQLANERAYHGYNHRGMAGFYHQLVEPIPDYKTRLTAGGRERLRTLRERYGEGADPS